MLRSGSVKWFSDVTEDPGSLHLFTSSFRMVDFFSLGLLPHDHKMTSRALGFTPLLNNIQDKKEGHASLSISLNQGISHKTLPAPSSLPSTSHWPEH